MVLIILRGKQNSFLFCFFQILLLLQPRQWFSRWHGQIWLVIKLSRGFYCTFFSYLTIFINSIVTFAICNDKYLVGFNSKKYTLIFVTEMTEMINTQISYCMVLKIPESPINYVDVFEIQDVKIFKKLSCIQKLLWLIFQKIISSCSCSIHEDLE